MGDPDREQHRGSKPWSVSPSPYLEGKGRPESDAGSPSPPTPPRVVWVTAAQCRDPAGVCVPGEGSGGTFCRDGHDIFHHAAAFLQMGR